jgi:hypothetical protein
MAEQRAAGRQAEMKAVFFQNDRFVFISLFLFFSFFLAECQSCASIH